MDGKRARSRAGKFPAGVLGTLVLMVIVEAFVVRHELDAVAPEDWQYLLARREAARQAKDCDLLILGDSQAKFGVISKVVSERSGRRSYNLAMFGSQAPASYELLRHVLETGVRPSAIVVDFYPLLLAQFPRSSLRRLPFFLSYEAALRLGWVSRDPLLAAELLVRQALPSVRSRESLQAWIRAVLEGRPSRYRSLMPEALSHWASNDGTQVVPAMPERPVDLAAHQRLAFPRGWTPARVNADYVRRFFELAEASGITVYWLIPPVNPVLQAASEVVGFDDRYLGFVRKHQQQFPGLVVIDGRHAGYDPSVFLDADHLGREGAFVLSQDLGDLLPRLARERPPSRWVLLPHYRPRRTDPEVVSARLEVFLPEEAARGSR
jgi:hypothetical protein